MVNRFREIIHFSPVGKGMPNGVCFQRGSYLHECQKNKDAFDISQSVPSKKKGNQNGGIIVFSNNVETDSIGSVPQCYNVSKAFRGQYIGANGKLYNKDSLTIEAYGLISKELLEYALLLSKLLHHAGVVVKDLNRNKMYIVEFT